MMTVQECIQYVESHLEIRLATNNGAYTCGRTINPVGCVNHSVGCAQPAVNVFYNSMNKSSAGWGVNALLGDFHPGRGYGFCLHSTGIAVLGVLVLAKRVLGTTQKFSGRFVNLQAIHMRAEQ